MKIEFYKKKKYGTKDETETKLAIMLFNSVWTHKKTILQNLCTLGRKNHPTSKIEFNKRKNKYGTKGETETKLAMMLSNFVWTHKKKQYYRKICTLGRKNAY